MNANELKETLILNLKHRKIPFVVKGKNFIIKNCAKTQGILDALESELNFKLLKPNEFEFGTGLFSNDVCEFFSERSAYIGDLEWGKIFKEELEDFKFYYRVFIRIS
jgi:hypothetical protein